MFLQFVYLFFPVDLIQTLLVNKLKVSEVNFVCNDARLLIYFNNYALERHEYFMARK